MLNRALEALAEVLEARFEESRLVKERAAVLSEMSMVSRFRKERKESKKASRLVKGCSGK